MRLMPWLVVLSVACRSGKEPDDSGAAGDGEDTDVVDADGDGSPADEDCDDGDASVGPDQSEVPYDGVDNDCDPATPDDDLDGDGHNQDVDCDDADATVNPDATEVCNDVDDDCNGDVDDAVGDLWYADTDGDGFGDPATETQECDGADGTVADATDCDDTDGAVFPDANEVCDGADNDCDDLVDDADPDLDASTATTFYADADGDGWGDEDAVTVACDPPSAAVTRSGDCDDGDPTVSPVATELCDTVDNDCDGDIDEASAADASTWYADTDGDGFGDADASEVACEPPSGHVADATDCDDAEAAVNPDAAEVCNTIDDDCNGWIDDDDPGLTGASTWYQDADGDGYGGTAWTLDACLQPSGFVSDATDCDDLDADASPAGTETCDGADNDCDGTVDEDDEVLGDAADCAAVDCADVLAGRPTATDGTYFLDPDGAGTFEGYCDMSTDGGGWTLVASFNNGDGAWAWTQYSGGINNLSAWRDAGTFGSVSAHTTADYKSEAYSRVDGTALMALDDGGEWLSFDGALAGASLLDEVTATSACTTSPVSGLSIDSSNPTAAANAFLTWYGGDPNNAGLCAFNFSEDSTDSSVIGMAGNSCGTAGFGHVGWNAPTSGHQDRDHVFCLASTPALNTTTSCSEWYGTAGLVWFDESGCSYASLYVR
jgi:hypothetical protein